MPLDDTRPVVTAFLSHAIEDAAIANTIKTSLEKLRIRVFIFESDLAHGQPIWNSVRSAISTSDYLFVLLSRASLVSDGVAREIGLAQELQSTRSTPVIIGITARSVPQMRIQPLRFDDQSPLGPPIDFGSLRNFSDWQNPDALCEFGRSLLPCLHIITSTSDDQRRLFERSKDCFVQLFPELRATDYLTKVWGWFQECDAPESFWRDILGLLQLNQTVIGLLYASVPKSGFFSFINYFGVLKGSRHLDRARRLLDSCEPQIHAINAGVRGMVFEVEVPDLALLETVVARPVGQPLSDVADQARLGPALRALSRLAIYQRNGARTLTSPDGMPLPIPKPSQQRTFLTDAVGQHLLMYYAWNSSDVNFSESDLDSLLHFVYDELYGTAYGEESETGFEGYEDYVAKLRSDFAGRIRGKSIIGKARIQRDVRMLLLDTELHGEDVDL